TAASKKVTTNRTKTNGTRSRRMASSHAKLSAPSWAGRGGVCGKVKLKAARSKEATPDTINVYVLAWLAAAPDLLWLRAVPSQSVKPTSPKAGTRVQSTMMKMKGQAAAIQPIVPHRRTNG